MPNALKHISAELVIEVKTLQLGNFKLLCFQTTRDYRRHQNCIFIQKLKQIDDICRLNALVIDWAGGSECQNRLCGM